jgi:hypothetical protein
MYKIHSTAKIVLIIIIILKRLLNYYCQRSVIMTATLLPEVCHYNHKKC